MSSNDSILGLPSEVNGKEDLDFTLQKQRIEEAFKELLVDLESLARVDGNLKQNPKICDQLLGKLKEVPKTGDGYEDFQRFLRELAKKPKRVGPSAEDDSTEIIQETIRKVRLLSQQSLLRPPSPPVVIKNRTEHETARWARVISLQESKIESLERKIEEYERKIVEREAERQRLRHRSDRERDEQQNASHTVLVEMKLEGDRIIQRLKENVDNQPAFETTPEYLSHLDQHQLKRKRIAKLEVQLQLWIKKYDKFVGEPMASLLALEERMSGLEEWKDTIFRPQEERLQQLREQVGAFEAAALQEKVEEMRKLHAVRVLQRAWKRTLEVKRAKKAKKSKKGKGKK